MILWNPLNTAVALFLGGSVVSNLDHWLIQHFGPRDAIIHTQWVILTLQTTFLFVSYYFVDFAIHVVEHKVPLLWSIHRAHHSTEALNYFAGNRAHPLESALGTFEDVWHLALFGGGMLDFTGTSMHPATVATFIAVRTIAGLGEALAHSHMPLNFGKFNYIIGSAALHQVHHSAELRHRDKNFGTILPVFAWLFGTLYPRRARSLSVGHQQRRAGRPEPTCFTQWILPRASLLQVEGADWTQQGRRIHVGYRISSDGCSRSTFLMTNANHEGLTFAP